VLDSHEVTGSTPVPPTILDFVVVEEGLGFGSWLEDYVLGIDNEVRHKEFGEFEFLVVSEV
jgi:hypothetical protein